MSITAALAALKPTKPHSMSFDAECQALPRYESNGERNSMRGCEKDIQLQVSLSLLDTHVAECWMGRSFLLTPIRPQDRSTRHRKQLDGRNSSEGTSQQRSRTCRTRTCKLPIHPVRLRRRHLAQRCDSPSMATFLPVLAPSKRRATKTRHSSRPRQITGASPYASRPLLSATTTHASTSPVLVRCSQGGTATPRRARSPSLASQRRESRNQKYYSATRTETHSTPLPDTLLPLWRPFLKRGARDQRRPEVLVGKKRASRASRRAIGTRQWNS